ncbi:MAG: hypothetical protein MK132_07535 [Lentisphaerales bacterium]|nr:hypothetical protein [Lentisphaerales bacterium]
MITMLDGTICLCQHICPNGIKHNADWNSTIALNSRISGKYQSGSSAKIKSMRLASPTETCMLMDSYDLWRSTSNDSMSLERLITDEESQVIARHFEKAKVTMVDGSGKGWDYKVLLSRNIWSDTFWDPEK